MKIQDMESLDENGTATLYARWVETKDIATEKELQEISKDLYGSYRLTADITLTEPWTPVGIYFSNYEFFAPEWWTYAFRGSFDGNGHTISGLQIRSSNANVSGYADQAAVWHDDGNRADGCAAMFGAITSADIRNVILQAPVIELIGENAVRGDYIYASAVAAFDMQSTLTNVTVNDPVINVEISDEASATRPSMFASVSAMVGGGWNDTLDGCHINGGTINVDAQTVISHGGAFYVGGMVGECYSKVNNSASSAEIKVEINDRCEEAEDSELSVHVGGLSAASTNTTDSQVNAVVSVDVKKPVGAASVNVGGLSGSQRYQSSANNTVKAALNTDCALDEELGGLNVGAVSGQLDVFYTTQILLYTPVADAGCSKNTNDVTNNGESVTQVIGMLPELDGTPLGWINKGEYEIAEGMTVPSNIEAVAEKYGSYMPIEYLQDGIIWIVAD